MFEYVIFIPPANCYNSTNKYMICVRIFEAANIVYNSNSIFADTLNNLAV